MNRADEDNNIHTYTVPSLGIETFPEYIANHVKHHLAHAVVEERGIKRGNFQASYEAALEEIEVTL